MANKVKEVKEEKINQKLKKNVIKKKAEKKKKSGRKNIRKVIKDCDLSVLTQIAAKNERDRKERLKVRKEKCSLSSSMIESDQLILDHQPLISVDKNLVKLLKPHQKQGVQFMWDACYESCDSLCNSTGGGCILAHCMGLGERNNTILCNSILFNIRSVIIL